MGIVNNIVQHLNDVSAASTKESDLTVITVAAKDKDSWLLHYMLMSVCKFTDVMPKIIICDNGGNGPLKKFYKDNKHISVVVDRTEKHANASVEHGIGLNRAFKGVTTSRTASIESDCVVLSKGWDEIEPGYKMTGVQKVKFIKQHNLRAYYPCYAVFHTDVMRGVDFKPDAGGRAKNGKDTGWQMTSRVKEADVSLADLIRCDDQRCEYFDKSYMPNAFELQKNGTTILAHIGRGSKVVRRGPGIIKKWKKQLHGILDIK